MFADDAAEIGEADLGRFRAWVLPLHHRELELDVVAVAGLLGFEIPLAFVGTPVRTPAESDRAVGQDHLAAFIQGHRFPFRIVGSAQLAIEVRGANVAVRHHHRFARGQLLFFQHHQHGHVGIAAHVVVEVRAARLAAIREVELLQDHVAHGHRHRRVGALLGLHPDVGQLGHLGIVRRDRHRLGTLVADFGEEMRIRRARLGHVGAPGNDVGRVVPVGRLRHIGLLAPDLRAGGWQVAVPVVEAHAHATDQAQVAAAGGIGNHGHGRNRGEADDAIRTVFLDRKDVGRSNHFIDFVPVRAHKPPQAAHGLVFLALRVGLGNRSPGLHRAHGSARRPPQLEQAPPHQRILDPVGAVQVPAVTGAAGAAARLVVGHVPAGARVVGLLGFPGDDAALDVDLPRAGAGAVHAVGGTHDLVVRPAVAVGVLPGPVFTGGDAMVTREGLPGT